MHGKNIEKPKIKYEHIYTYIKTSKILRIRDVATYLCFHKFIGINVLNLELILLKKYL